MTSTYDNGGILHPGMTLAVNDTEQPEPVLTANQNASPAQTALTTRPRLSRRR